jgi:hypothetical protein
LTETNKNSHSFVRNHWHLINGTNFNKIKEGGKKFRSWQNTMEVIIYASCESFCTIKKFCSWGDPNFMNFDDPLS